MKIMYAVVNITVCFLHIYHKPVQDFYFKVKMVKLNYKTTLN